MLPRVRHGIEFTQRDDSNGELRITGDDDAALLLWGAAWLDEQSRAWPATPAYRPRHWPAGRNAPTHTGAGSGAGPSAFE